MRILVVTPFPVLPLSHGGRVRTQRLAAALAAAGATVDVVFPWHPGLPARPFRRDGVTCHPHAFVTNILPFIFRDRVVPSLVALSWQPFVIGPRRRLHAFAGYDVAEFHFCAYASWMERIPSETKVVYSAHNVEYDYLRAQPVFAARRALSLRLAQLERRALDASALVVTCTHEDSHRLDELYGGRRRYEVIPQGLDDDLLQLDRHASRDVARTALGLTPDELAVLFVGGPARHNREAVAFLENEVGPRLRGNAQILIAGRCSRRDDGRARSGSRVRRLGYVADLRPLYAAADIAVNPVAYGSGSSVKVAECLAAGLPVLTTPVGRRGYDHVGQLIRIAELDDFAEAILSPTPALDVPRSELGNFTWSALGRRLLEVYRQLPEQ